MKGDDFVKKTRDWLTGQPPWPEMDDYAIWLKATLDIIIGILEGELFSQLILPFET